MHWLLFITFKSLAYITYISINYIWHRPTSVLIQDGPKSKPGHTTPFHFSNPSITHWAGITTFWDYVPTITATRVPLWLTYAHTSNTHTCTHKRTYYIITPPPRSLHVLMQQITLLHLHYTITMQLWEGIHT